MQDDSQYFYEDILFSTKVIKIFFDMLTPLFRTDESYCINTSKSISFYMYGRETNRTNNLLGLVIVAGKECEQT